jgi:hypothetical protein
VAAPPTFEQEGRSVAKRLVAVLLVVVMLVPGALPITPGTADTRRPDGLLSGEWSAGAASADATGAGEHTIVADFPANAIMVEWSRAGTAEDAMAEVSVSPDGRAWSPWQLAPVDEDSDGRFEHERRFTGAVMVAPSRYIRVRGVNTLGQPGIALVDLTVSYLNTLAGPETDSAGSLEAAASKKKPTPTPTPPADDVGEGPPPDEPPPPSDQPAPPLPPPPSTAGAGELVIIPRAGWGADEKLRFRNGKEIWPREYQIAEKVVLHHTETPNGQDPMAAIRAVYYFHAVRKGWGDIGYNYLVDSAGRVYEGRAGGDNVISGHALRYNNGSIGIAVLGSYQSTTITPAAEEAIVALIAGKARALDPIGRSWFIDKTLPNIAGHRDCLNTACPGNAFYPRLPAIRDKVLQRIGYRPTPSVKITDVQIAPTDLRTGDRLEVRATITNTGTALIPSDAKGPGVGYTEGQDYDQRGLPKVTGKLRLGLEAVGSSTRYPYRWGLGRALLPGESITVTGSVQMTNPQERTFHVALVQEYIRYWEQDVADTVVRVTGPPLNLPPAAPTPEQPPVDAGPKPSDRQPAPAGPEPNRSYYPETGHYLGYGFRYYWEKNGGLAQFGFPITEEFREVNPADGKEYTVQYFERARFEYHPEHKGTQFEVLLGLLGNQVTAGRNFPKAEPGSRPPSAGARYFPETRQWLGGPLLKAWTERGGLMTYGYPISPEMDEVNPDDGKTYRVQYFERNRLEHHPEHKGTPHEVLLGLLGRQVLVERGWLTR